MNPKDAVLNMHPNDVIYCIPDEEMWSQWHACKGYFHATGVCPLPLGFWLGAGQKWVFVVYDRELFELYYEQEETSKTVEQYLSEYEAEAGV